MKILIPYSARYVLTELLAPQEIPCSVQFRVRNTSNLYKILVRKPVDDILLGQHEDVRELWVSGVLLNVGCWLNCGELWQYGVG